MTATAPPDPTPAPDRPPAARPWPALSPLQRFGPLVLVVALVVGAGVVATTKGKGSGPSSPKGDEQEIATNTAESYAELPQLAVSYEEAKEAGTLDEYDWGDHCDPETGRTAFPSVYAPPCVPVWDGAKPWVDRGGEVHDDNGGETAPGVTEDTITIVYYRPSPQDITASLQAFGVLDPQEVAEAGLAKLVDAANELYETYGRKVEIKSFQSSGDGKSPATARADARKVAKDMGAFASIGGPTQTGAYQDELARQGVLCFGCGYSTPDAAYQRDAPYAWGQLASPDQLLYGVFDFGVKNLFGKPARFAGNPDYRDQTRVFGIVHYDQDPPVFGDLQREAVEKYKAEGYEAKVLLTYLLDLNTLPKQAQAIVTQLKAEGVTSVVFLGDPLMPKYLTEQATAQDYFPEWIITGTVFTDSTSAARLYDPQQWAHAFGASSLPARTAPELSEPARLYEWWFGEQPEALKTVQLLGPLVSQVFIGIQGAGPELTAETYAGAMFRYPVSGGGPTTPRISFGFHGLFDKPDWVGVDDFTNVWWDGDAVGPDEGGREGTGMWRYAAGGQRLVLGDVPGVDDGVLFGETNAPAILDAVPEKDLTTPYDPWDESPAAGGG